MLRRIAAWSPPRGPGRAPARRAHDAGARRPGDRAARRLGGRRRRADLLPGADRQRGLPAHRDRAPLGARAGARRSATSSTPASPPRPISSGRSSGASRSQGQTPPGMAPPPREVLVAAGTKVQSLPGQDELPQTFETQRRPRRPQRLQRAAPAADRPAAGEPRLDGALHRGHRHRLRARRPRAHHRAPALRRRGAVDRKPPGVDVSLLEVTDVVPEPERGRTRLDLDALAEAPAARRSRRRRRRHPPDRTRRSSRRRRRRSRRSRRPRSSPPIMVARPASADGRGDRASGSLKFAWNERRGCSPSSRSCGWNPAVP